MRDYLVDVSVHMRQRLVLRRALVLAEAEPEVGRVEAAKTEYYSG